MKRPQRAVHYLEILAFVAIASTTLTLSSLDSVRSQVPCLNATECDDNNPCTNDTCLELNSTAPGSGMGGAPCTGNCTVGCVHIPLNSTGCNLDNGDSCQVNGQCSSTFCVDGICCDTACNGQAQVCNVPGRVGTCTDVAPAPAVSWNGMLLVGIVLVGVGILGINRALRTH